MHKDKLLAVLDAMQDARTRAHTTMNLKLLSPS